jgi:hypothetical protein
MSEINNSEKLPVLSHTNVFAWKEALKAKCIHDGSWKFLEENPANSDGDYDMDDADELRERKRSNKVLKRKALGTILKMIPPHIVQDLKISSNVDPKELMNAALKRVVPHTHVNKFALMESIICEKFSGINQEECFVWIAKKEFERATLKDMELEIPEEMVTLGVLKGLPGDFSAYVRDYNSRPDLTLDVLKSVIQVYFVVKTSKAELDQKDDT